MKILIFIIFIFTLICKAQPYIYSPINKTDTINGEAYNFQELHRYNIRTNSVENFPPQNYANFYLSTIYDPIQDYLAINFGGYGYIIYDCSDTSNYFYLPDSLINFSIDELLYSKSRNELYIFAKAYSQLYLYNTLSHQFTLALTLPHQNDSNTLLYPYRNTFFSADQNKIYFFSVDTTNKHNQVWTYSIESNSIVEKRNISDLGYPNKDGYELVFGENGKGIICSYTNQQTFNSYYRVYDFDSDTGSTEFYKDSLSESYFSSNGEFLLIMNTAWDTVNYDHYTGTGYIYNTKTEDLIKTISVPPAGKIYVFDNYPNDIYYALNTDSLNNQPEVYNLTKLKLNSVSPPTAMQYFSLGELNVLTVTLTGEFFTDSTIVYFDGNAKQTNYVSDSVVTFSLNSPALSTIGNKPIWLSNYGSISDTMYFSVVDSLPQTVNPVFECIQDNGDHTYTAYYGYNNHNSFPVGIVPSVNNQFDPNPDDRGQPRIFYPGTHSNVFSVTFDGNNLTWTLVGNSIRVNKKYTPCQ